MSKAYDTVHIPLLQKALHRIGIPTQFTNLITNIFNSHRNQVITTIGKTQPYNVEYGIDQDETISPILLRIYYDPLLCHIRNSTLGYSMTANTPNPNQTLTVTTNVITYMDDTT